MRIMVLEFRDYDSLIFDEIMEVVNRHLDIEYLSVKDEQVLSIPGLEIYPGRRKIYRDRWEINLTAKEYDLYGDESNAISATCGRNYTKQNRMHLLQSGA